MSIAGEILNEMWNTSVRYKGMRVNLFGIPKFKDKNYGTLKSSISQLKKKGYIEYDTKGWYLTQSGKEYIKKKQNSLKQFEFKFPKSAPKDLILMFDVPEIRKGEREWLRWHLKKFDYLMIQKSVWVGPSPLPKEFKNYLESIGLKDNIKTFKLAKGYKSI